MNDIEIPYRRKCNVCKNMTAELVSYENNIAEYFCKFCKSTFAGSIKEGNELMGKRKIKKGKNKKNTTSVSSIVSSAADDSWETKIECVKECSKVPDKVNIWVHPLAKRKIDALMAEYKKIEWLAYLIGDIESKEIYDIFVPKQDISTARVDNVVCEEYNEIKPIGVIHSHHDMGHSFSGTDHEWINQNHDISLVISHNGIAGQCRMKTECGAFKIVDVDVKLKINIEFDDKKFIEKIKGNLKEKTYTYNSYGSQTFGNGYGYGYGYGNGYGYQGKRWVDDDEEDEKSFLTKTELDEIDKEIEELDFEKELSLAEELEMLNETKNPDDAEEM